MNPISYYRHYYSDSSGAMHVVVSTKSWSQLHIYDSYNFGEYLGSVESVDNVSDMSSN